MLGGGELFNDIIDDWLVLLYLEKPTSLIVVGTAEYEKERCSTRSSHCFVELLNWNVDLLSDVITSGVVYGVPADWDQAYIEFDDRADQSRKVARIYVDNELLDDPDDKVPK